MQIDALHRANLRGQDEVIAVCDTGLDLGDPNAPHPFISRNRIKAMLAYRRKKADDPHGHGTHIIGCIVADPDPAGNHPLSGIAPAARVVVQSVFRTVKEPFGNRPINLNSLLTDAYSRGARIHSNSWVQINSSTEYTTTAESIDRFVHEHPEFVVVTAVANEGHFAGQSEPDPVPQTLRSPAMAKNVISVGAVENLVANADPRWTYANFFNSDQLKRLPTVYHNDSWANDERHWAPFSATGPTADGRIKPDVVAPGTAIISSRSRAGTVRSVWGDCSAANCAILGGTSIAAPLVAAACALIRQHLRNNGLANPTAALIKAVLINGAAQDVQVLTLPQLHYPNPIAGWGRVRLADSVEAGLWFSDERVLPRAGAFVSIPVRFSTPGPLRVTIAWTDPPGRGLRSDLDLEVNAQGAHLGNDADRSNAPDTMNNVEHVRIDNVQQQAEVRVSARRLSAGAQRFAIAILGGSVQTNQITTS